MSSGREGGDHHPLPGEVARAPQPKVAHCVGACTTTGGLARDAVRAAIARDDEATGNNLADRLEVLSTKVLLPKTLIDGLTNLRLLGNDAAHLEAQTYNSVGSDEIAVAMEVTIAILRSVYQMGDLVAKLDALKRI